MPVEPNHSLVLMWITRLKHKTMGRVSRILILALVPTVSGTTFMWWYAKNLRDHYQNAQALSGSRWFPVSEKGDYITYNVSLQPVTHFIYKLDGSNVQLTWDEVYPGYNVAYRVYRQPINGNYSIIATTNQNHYEDHTVQDGHTYSYYVSVFSDSNVESKPSELLHVTVE